MPSYEFKKIQILIQVGKLLHDRKFRISEYSNEKVAIVQMFFPFFLLAYQSYIDISSQKYGVFSLTSDSSFYFPPMAIGGVYIKDNVGCTIRTFFGKDMHRDYTSNGQLYLFQNNTYSSQISVICDSNHVSGVAFDLSDIVDDYCNKLIIPGHNKDFQFSSTDNDVHACIINIANIIESSNLTVKTPKVNNSGIRIRGIHTPSSIVRDVTNKKLSEKIRLLYYKSTTDSSISYNAKVLSDSTSEFSLVVDLITNSSALYVLNSYSGIMIDASTGQQYPLKIEEMDKPDGSWRDPIDILTEQTSTLPKYIFLGIIVFVFVVAIIVSIKLKCSKVDPDTLETESTDEGVYKPGNDFAIQQGLIREGAKYDPLQQGSLAPTETPDLNTNADDENKSDEKDDNNNDNKGDDNLNNDSQPTKDVTNTDESAMPAESPVRSVPPIESSMNDPLITSPPDTEPISPIESCRPVSEPQAPIGLIDSNTNSSLDTPLLQH
ncbi:hypothetical protein TRFO_08795 [Tritrichomonas foetus]|uniref:Uncharacterized protein n=1 Tax=Tritrichomonas foetus TaxID=1144522 RepID=A0A1J4JLV3_9EUKA|nr:hypothetical protein TRFO_08795 [Tritrichomonas foetus]|eukprot:OHS98531.1 hypothetical protein TRFO_08795 [Tritrichomonas foetus]